jgi:hypothetical protein
VIGYSDLDFAGCVDSRKCTFGYVFLLAGAAISWKSAKQTSISTSTMEAEFIACFEASLQISWLRNYVSGLGVVSSISKPMKLYCDNSAAVFFSKNDKYSRGAKHMELKYLVVKEEVRKQRLSIDYIGTQRMIADPLTKALPPKAFIEHVNSMGLEDGKL